MMFAKKKEEEEKKKKKKKMMMMKMMKMMMVNAPGPAATWRRRSLRAAQGCQCVFYSSANPNTRRNG